MICVYPADCADFSTNGNGVLSPLTVQVTETLNGEYELQLTHPIDAAGKWQRLVEGCILRAPVPSAMTSRVNYTAPGDDNRTEVWRVNTDFAGAETRRGTLNLRNGPGRNYKVLAAYKNTSLVQVIAKTSNDWYEVTAPDGKRGYMSTTYLVFDHSEGSASEAVSAVVEERQLRDQSFRIYRVVPELDKITVYARHIFYDLIHDVFDWARDRFPVVQIRRYADITELDAVTLNKLVRQVVVHEEIGTDRTRKISVEIHFNMKQPHMQE